MLSKNLSTLMLAGLLMIQQPINAEKNDHIAAIAIGVATITAAITGTIGYYVGYANNDKVAKNQNHQILTDVENIQLMNEFSQLHYLELYAKRERLDFIKVLADAYSSGSLSINGNQISAYCQKAYASIKNLENHVLLWEKDSSFNKQLLNEAQQLLKSNKTNEKLKKILELQEFAGQMQNLEPYFSAYKYFMNVKDKSYNHDGKEFALVYAVKEMQQVREQLGDHKQKLINGLKNNINNSFYLNALIEEITKTCIELENSIVNIRNSEHYQTQIKDKNFSDKQDQLIIAQLLNEKNRDQELNLKLQEQRQYEANWKNTKKQLEIVRQQKEECLEKLNKEENNNKKLKEEIKKLEAQVKELEKEINQPKPALSAQDESNRIDELKRKEKELENLKHEIEIMKSKIKTNNLPVSPDDALVSLINWIKDL